MNTNIAKYRYFIVLIASMLFGSVFISGCVQGTKRANIETRKLASKGKFDKALEQAKKTLSIAEQNLENHKGLAAAIDNLAISYQKLGKYEKAEPLFRRSLDLRTKNLKPDDSGIAVSLNLLGNVLKTRGQLSKAEPLLERSVKILKKSKGKKSAEVALASINLGELYYRQNKFNKAEKSYKTALSILEKRRGYKQEVGVVMANMALLYQTQGHYKKAAKTLKKALSKQQAALGSNHPDIGLLLNSLSQLNAHQGRYTKAEEQCSKALGILEKALGSNHPRIAMMLRNYAGILVKQGRYGEAVPLIKKALTIQKKSVGEKHPDIASSRMMLARIYYDAQLFDKAIEEGRKALTIRETVFGRNNTMVAKSYNSLGEMYRADGNTTEALSLMKQALAISKKTYGSRHVETAKVQGNLATIYVNMNRYAEAENMYMSAKSIFEKNLGAKHPRVTAIQYGLSKLYLASGQIDNALLYARKASASFSENIHGELEAGLGDSALGFRLGRELFQTYLNVVSKAMKKHPSQHEKLIGEAFRIIQLAQITGTSQALSKMAARFAATSEKLAELVRKREDKIDETKILEHQLIKSVGLEKAKRNLENEKTIRKRIKTVKKELVKLDRTLERRFPQYAELTSPRPFTLDKIRQILKGNEVLVAYFASPDETFVFSTTRKKAVLHRTGLNEKALADRVKHLRRGLDPVNIGSDGEIPDYDVVSAYNLYNKLLKPIENLIKNAKNIIIVPASALESLPFAVLATKRPASSKKPDYLKTAWLTNKYSLTVVPSVSSLRALRAFARPTKAVKSFAGFGDPKLSGKTSCSTNVEMLHQMSELPESADELKAIAKTLKAGKDAVFLRNNATEKNVREAGLDDYRVLAFATHGLMAGDFKGLSEPALVLTPPEYVESTKNNGLLTASEISELKLDAEWVVLSACNTAAPSGEVGAEGLSGLAKAFFYAGSRSMLVSNWEVETTASVKLTTGIFSRLSKNPTMPKAEALRLSMTALMHDKDEPIYAHPMFWAPFSLVGEGGVMSKQP
ncbi:MAG: CHAT domain-containing protein [Alphaproteobacteria bacterium]|nr:CHAT domain-containing protein [Alphaproteobacteria bacterium]